MADPLAGLAEQMERREQAIRADERAKARADALREVAASIRATRDGASEYWARFVEQHEYEQAVAALLALRTQERP